MTASTWIVEPSGRVTVEGVDLEDLVELMGDDPEEVNCAMPLAAQIQERVHFAHVPEARTARISKIWFGSVVEGPGRRNVVQFQGCPIRCAGCYVPQTHDFAGGLEESVADIALMLCAPSADGVTILGGEPFAQPEALRDLVVALKARDMHVLVYSGFTLKALYKKGNLAIDEVLCMIDMLIDGPYIQTLSDDPGEYRGSRNQRILTQTDICRELDELRHVGGF